MDYRLPAASGHPPTVLTDTTCLTVSLGGLSKAVGLPQLKLAWMAVAGPDRDARDLLDRLELVGDSFLSVGTPIQAALPAILARGAAVRDQIRARVADNLAVTAASPRGVARHPTARARRRLDGGAARARRRAARKRSRSICWSVITSSSSPGYFYDFPSEAWLVVSLLVEPEPFARGIERIVAATAMESDKMDQGPR